jgi:hypothetical protein
MYCVVVCVLSASPWFDDLFLCFDWLKSLCETLTVFSIIMRWQGLFALGIFVVLGSCSTSPAFREYLRLNLCFSHQIGEFFSLHWFLLIVNRMTRSREKDILCSFSVWGYSLDFPVPVDTPWFRIHPNMNKFSSFWPVVLWNAMTDYSELETCRQMTVMSPFVTKFCVLEGLFTSSSSSDSFRRSLECLRNIVVCFYRSPPYHGVTFTLRSWLISKCRVSTLRKWPEYTSFGRQNLKRQCKKVQWISWFGRQFLFDLKLFHLMKCDFCWVSNKSCSRPTSVSQSSVYVFIFHVCSFLSG